ncbi:DUF6093 family protein [Streptomyces sp. NEAU-H3]|uniref:DUF6093 family protein n=1 Tax=Streptomyces sp. NEAU-H3 TaxID=2720636 RepID=UPI00143C3388|nr:DUF6093 family protein [Streptomyces sp. NEAU-H3]NJA59403.1 hypothetical protein [Streptomyces sp. NEAU-H3]
MPGLDQALAGVTAWVSANLLLDTVRLTRPMDGQPVLDEETGQLLYPEDVLFYEGPGAVLPSSATVERSMTPDATQPWAPQTKSAYVLFTPLGAPVPREGAVVEVIQVHDPARAALLGRSWLCADRGLASTVEVVRRTPLDQNREAAP